MRFQDAAMLALYKPLTFSGTSTGRYSSKKKNYSQKPKHEPVRPPYSGMGANGGDGLGWKCWE